MSKAVLAWLGVLFIAMGGTLLWLGIKYSQPAFTVRVSKPELDLEYRLPPASAGEVYLTEFTLTERDGRKLGTADLQGRVFVTNFFFSTCPHECAQQQAAYHRVQEEFGPKGVQFISITCDPEIDTPSRLAAYADQNGFAKDSDSWWFLTGDLNYIRRVAGEYYQVALKRWTHTEKFEVRDKWGNPRGSFNWKDSASLADLKLTLNKLLTETEPPADVKAAAEERAAMIERAKENAAEKPAEPATPAAASPSPASAGLAE